MNSMIDLLRSMERSGGFVEFKRLQELVRQGFVDPDEARAIKKPYEDGTCQVSLTEKAKRLLRESASEDPPLQ